MALGYEKITESIAREISKQRAKEKKGVRKVPYEQQVLNALKSTSNQDRINHLQSTLAMLKSPSTIINSIKKEGFGKVAQDFIDPVSCIVVKNSFLSPKNKAKLIKNIHSTSKMFKIKENTNTSDMKDAKQTEPEHFKHVA